MGGARADSHRPRVWFFVGCDTATAPVAKKMGDHTAVQSDTLHARTAPPLFVCQGRLVPSLGHSPMAPVHRPTGAYVCLSRRHSIPNASLAHPTEVQRMCVVHANHPASSGSHHPICAVGQCFCERSSNPNHVWVYGSARALFFARGCRLPPPMANVPCISRNVSASLCDMQRTQRESCSPLLKKTHKRVHIYRETNQVHTSIFPYLLRVLGNIRI